MVRKQACLASVTTKPCNASFLLVIGVIFLFSFCLFHRLKKLFLLAFFTIQRVQLGICFRQHVEGYYIRKMNYRKIKMASISLVKLIGMEFPYLYVGFLF
jgi:hypothetical protein